MQPEVLAWALLFVIGFGIVYRFFAWAGRRFGRKPALPEISPDAGATFGNAPLPSRTPEPAMSRATPAEPPHDPPEHEVPQSAYKPLDIYAPAPAPAVDYASAPSPEDAARTSRPSVIAAARSNGARAMPVGAGAVMAAQIAATKVRTAIAPSVAATLPPFRQQSDGATVGPPTEAISAELPPDCLVAQTDTETASVAKTAMPESSDNDAMPSREQQDRGGAQPRIFLRAWRIGTEAPSLDLRLRDARDRKVVQTPKTARGPSEPHGAKELKVLVAKTSPEKTPARRIMQKIGDDLVIASVKARLRVVGVRPCGPRSLAAPTV